MSPSYDNHCIEGKTHYTLLLYSVTIKAGVGTGGGDGNSGTGDFIRDLDIEHWSSSNNGVSLVLVYLLMFLKTSFFL